MGVAWSGYRSDPAVGVVYEFDAGGLGGADGCGAGLGVAALMSEPRDSPLLPFQRQLPPHVPQPSRLHGGSVKSSRHSAPLQTVLSGGPPGPQHRGSQQGGPDCLLQDWAGKQEQTATLLPMSMRGDGFGVESKKTRPRHKKRTGFGS